MLKCNIGLRGCTIYVLVEYEYNGKFTKILSNRIPYKHFYFTHSEVQALRDELISWKLFPIEVDAFIQTAIDTVNANHYLHECTIANAFAVTNRDVTYD